MGINNGYPGFLNLGAEGTRGFEQMPLAAGAAPIKESVLPNLSAGDFDLRLDWGARSSLKSVGANRLKFQAHR